jgi:DNA-binding NtrC family response regulator
MEPFATAPQLHRAAAHNATKRAVEPAGGTLAGMEREYIIRVLKETGGVIRAASTRLGMPRTTLNAKMRKLGIHRMDR